MKTSEILDNCAASLITKAMTTKEIKQTRQAFYASVWPYYDDDSISFDTLATVIEQGSK